MVSKHTDLRLKMINYKAKCFYNRFHNSLGARTNPVIQNLASVTLPGNPPRRPKRKRRRDLLLD